VTTFADIIAEIVARLERNAADARGDSFEAGRKDAYSYAAQIVKEIAASHDLRAAALATLDSLSSGEDMAAGLRDFREHVYKPEYLITHRDEPRGWDGAGSNVNGVDLEVGRG